MWWCHLTCKPLNVVCQGRFLGNVVRQLLKYINNTCLCRCPFCQKDAPYSLQKDVRRMNQHLQKIHDAQSITSDQFQKLDSVMATKDGPKGSFVEVKEQVVAEDPRSESTFESRVGLLNSGLLFLGDEHHMACNLSFFFKFEGLGNPFLEGVMEIFQKAFHICKRPGSTLVRQQMMRNADSLVTCKVFIPICQKTIPKYAIQVANFVYFCNKAPWDGPSTRRFRDVQDCLFQVLTEPNISISQTFISR
jgi:hypothetical protein